MTENSTPMYMPVAPAYGYGGGNGGFGNMFGGDGWWLILLFLLCGNGMWGGFGGGMWPMMMGGMGGGWGLDYLYPWLNNSQHISDGFRDQTLQTSITGLQNSVTSGFGDVQTALCGGFAGVNASINGAQNALAQQMYTNQIADLERSYAAQTANTAGLNAVQAQLAQCCCDNRAATNDLKYVIATEACNTRSANTANTQAILDKLCALELDNVKAQVAAEQRENANLRSELMYARGQASQVDQTAQIRTSQATIANQLVSELRSCPIPAQPVYGNQPIFTCPTQFGTGCGCGCGNGF